MFAHSGLHARPDNANIVNRLNAQPLYHARVLLDKTHIQVENKQVNLSPGMAVTVEIKTGQRRIIEYFLSPLMEYAHESLGER